MTGFAFIVLVFLQGMPAPVADITLMRFVDTHEECAANQVTADEFLTVGEPHPIIGHPPIAHYKTFCLEMWKPPAENEKDS